MISPPHLLTLPPYLSTSRSSLNTRSSRSSRTFFKSRQSATRASLAADLLPLLAVLDSRHWPAAETCSRRHRHRHRHPARIRGIILSRPLRPQLQPMDMDMDMDAQEESEPRATSFGRQSICRLASQQREQLSKLPSLPHFTS